MVAYPGFSKQAATPLAGVALSNAVVNILTWTVPNDGQMHRVSLYFECVVTVAQTGGVVILQGFAPDGTEFFWEVNQGNQAPGYVFFDTAMNRLVQPGSTVTLQLNTPQSAGAAKIWAEIWGS